MQTFLPYPSYSFSVKVLDWKRLGKQRVEARQILNVLMDSTKMGWRNHPAVLMWKGYEKSLALYLNETIREWEMRGYVNNMEYEDWRFTEKIVHPPWLGDNRFHSSHRSNLLRKDPDHYGGLGWIEPNNLPYFWPTKEKDYVNKETS